MVISHIEVSNDNLRKCLIKVCHDSGLALTHLTFRDIDEGKFFPSVKYKRLVDGEINESECYSFLDQMRNFTKDPTDLKNLK